MPTAQAGYPKQLTVRLPPMVGSPRGLRPSPRPSA